MDNFGSGLEVNFRQLANSHGMPIKVDLQSRSFNAADYDVATFAASGTQQAGSCIFLPVGNGGDEAAFLHQGVITLADKKVLIPSGVQITSDALVTVNAGSYSVIEYNQYWVENNLIYTRAFLRTKLP